MAVAILGLPLPAAMAAGETLAVVLGERDGTPAFDADNTAGHDSADNNGIVRTNDNIVYSVDVSSTGGTADNTTISLVLPKGVQFDQIPAYCTGPGSSLVPATMPGPTMPVTATSWQSLPVQTLVCNVGQVTSGSTRTWDLVARVRPEVPNGTVLPGISASVTSTGVTTPVTSNVIRDITVSSAPQFNLGKNSIALTENTGYFYGDTRPCVKDPTKLCTYMVFPVLISAPQGGKGISPIAGPITFTDDLSAAALFGPSVLTDPDYLPTMGGSLVSCSASHLYLNPGSSGGGIYNVRNSGTMTCAQAGGPGTPVTATITGADTTAYTYPSRSPYPKDVMLPADRAYVFSGYIAIEIPKSVTVALGSYSSSIYTLNFTNRFTNFAAADTAGTPVADTTPTDDYRKGTTTVTSSGSMDKYFVGVPGAVGNTPPAEFNPGWTVWEGPAAGTGTQTGTGQLFAGGVTISNINLANRSTDGNPMSFMACDSWDKTKLQLTSMNYSAGPSTPSLQKITPNGAAVWLSGFQAPGVTATTLQQALDRGVANVKYQYGTGPGGPGSASTCGAADSPSGWFDDPASVPGNDPALAGQGIYSAVTRVRIFATLPSDVGYSTASFGIGLRALDGLTVGTILPNWATAKVVPGSLTPQDLLADTRTVAVSTYNPTLNSGNPGDRLFVAAAVGRLTKEVWSRATGSWTTTTVPQYAGGQTVDFRLKPTVTSGITAEANRQVVVEDCLPASETFLSASVTPSAVVPIAGPMPPGSTIVCASGETYVKWDLGLKPVNVEIAPITYTVRVAPTVVPGVYTNTALITVQDDLSAVSTRDAQAQIQVVQPKGVWVDKVALTPIIEVNHAAEAVKDPLLWRVDLVNIEAPSPTPTDVDIIDVLPKNGLNTTSYTGSLTFVSATVTSGSTASQPVEVLYTKAAAVSVDASDPTNHAATGIAWCNAVAGGAVVLGTGPCPASAAEVTGLRIRRPGTFQSGTTISFTLEMLPIANAKGDVYDNQAAARAGGLQLMVGPVNAVEVVIASSIGDFVWMDTNSNGVQDAGEPGIGSFGVKLDGTDSDGNLVSLTTTTDASGHYLFSGLQSGNYQVTFDPTSLAGLGSEHYFTLQDSGDEALDSDGDRATGVTAVVALSGASDITHLDQGVVTSGVGIVKQVCTTGSGCDQGVEAQWVEAASVFPGDEVQWRLKVTNTGGVDLTDVKVTDPLVPACEKTFASLAAHAVETFACAAPTSVSIEPNTATVTATTPNGGTLTANDPASVTVFSGSVGDTVWYDVNGDGVQDPAEPGIANATVTVTVTDPNTGTPRTFTTTTDANGHYQVSGLPGGTVTVAVSAVDPDFLATYDLDGTASLSTTQVTLADGQQRTDVDFGFTVKFAVGNTIWIDSNGDGDRDAGEPMVPDGTAVQLWNATTSTVVAATTTTGGVYGFTELPAGDYYVVIPAAALTGPLVGAVPSAYGAVDPDNDVDQTADHNAVQGQSGAIQTGVITLSATLSSAAGAQILGNEPTAGFLNNTLDLAILTVPAIEIVKEVCNPATGGGSCDPAAALGADGWDDVSYAATFLESITWRITVKNTGLPVLSNVAVTDELVPGCVKSDIGTLQPGQSTSYVCSTAILLVGFTNSATVTGTGPGPNGPGTGTPVTDTDIASVTTPAPNPGIAVKKYVVSEGVSADADAAPGGYAAAGSSALWLYDVVLPQGVNVPLRDVSVTDDNGTPANTADDWAAEYLGGDDGDGFLEVGETWSYRSPVARVLAVPAGQYTNMATAFGTPVSPGNSAPIAAQDPANIFGVAADIDVVKFTNEQDANTATGPALVVGDPVTWRYLVKNTGNVPLIDVSVVDDKGVAVTCGVSDADHDGDIDVLGVGPALWVSCTASGTASAGQYANVATVTGTPADANGVTLVDLTGAPFPKPTDTDPSHYFGVQPGVSLVKTTQTLDNDDPTGPFVKAGDPVAWTFAVTNTGTTALTNVTVTDDRVAASAIDCGQGPNVIALLLPGATASCTATGVAVVGQYANTGAVSGSPALPPAGANLADPSSWPTDPQVYTLATHPDGSVVAPVTDTNPDHYFGMSTGVNVTKFVNGVDANSPYGVFVEPGSTVTWTFVVVNTGSTALTEVTVVDDRLADDSAINCGATANVIALLLPGASATCTATGTAVSGAYANIGTATGQPALPLPADGVDQVDSSTWPTDPAGFASLVTITQDGSETVAPPVSDHDPAHYFGVQPGVSIIKSTNSVDANDPTGPFVPVAGPVVWTFAVTNTGNTGLRDVTVTDDKVAATDIDCGLGSNVIALLLPGETVTCQASAAAAAGQYANLGSVVGMPVMPDPTLEGVDLDDPTSWPPSPEAYGDVTDQGGTPVPPVTDEDPSHYFGAVPGIDVVKDVCLSANPAECDVADDGDWTQSVQLPESSAAVFRITVRNTGNVVLAPVAVTDPLSPACDRAFPSLAAGGVERYVCQLGSVGAGLVNVATASGQPVDGGGNPVVVPGTDTPVPAVTDTDDASVTVPLPQTGSDFQLGLALGLTLILLGSAMVSVTRRRRRSVRHSHT